MRIRFQKLRDDAKIPTKATNFAAGIDIATVDEYLLAPQECHIFHTGLAASIEIGYCVVLFDRSGMGAKLNIHRLAGVIDSDYRGEWLVCLTNLSDKAFHISSGRNIIQGLILPVPELFIEEVNSLDETVRGIKGFGMSDTIKYGSSDKQSSTGE